MRTDRALRDPGGHMVVWRSDVPGHLVTAEMVAAHRDDPPEALEGTPSAVRE